MKLGWSVDPSDGMPVLTTLSVEDALAAFDRNWPRDAPQWHFPPGHEAQLEIHWSGETAFGYGNTLAQARDYAKKRTIDGCMGFWYGKPYTLTLRSLR